ncbi:MAG: Hemagglutinin esterase [Rhodobacteraceae bacterium HLUCCA08]|nr:MAG: Hemagglutinin esterase [Rhodobacteraceae bacterium HLUCCA08]
MKRAIAFLVTCATLPLPALAWEFSPEPICTLSQAAGTGQVTVTFDPALPEYGIAITLAEGAWDQAPVFAIVFEGARPLTISTDRHVLSDEGMTLTVRDRGFGNVLNGLQFNTRAIARSGATSVTIPLVGASPEVQAFRECPAPATS